MKLIISLISPLASAAKNTIRYVENLIVTKGRKTCTGIGRANNRSHDAVQRDLNAIAENPEYARQSLINNAIDKAREWKGKGALIIDATLIRKLDANAMEGVSVQHKSNKEKVRGISLTAVVLTNLEKIVCPVDLFTWKKGDGSKIKKGVDFVVNLAQKVGVQTILADAAYATDNMFTQCKLMCLKVVARFPKNRVVSLAPDGPGCAIQDHEAFRFKRNKRVIIKEVYWNGHKLRIIALKLKKKWGGWNILYLATNVPFEEAYQYAEYYAKRWGVEVFFRTEKQDFGLEDCQAHSLKQQEAHFLAAFCAYNEVSRKRPINPTKTHRQVKKVRIKIQKSPMQLRKTPYNRSLNAFA
jgi:hypothetical protein